ncbi:DUF4291 domain-containing protein [Streptomyces sp. NBC_00433]
MSVPSREIRALYDSETITVYQAYSPAVAEPAAAGGRFSAGYSRDRMTWIKPSFLWMMYRSSWGTAVGQERVLAIRIRRDGFEWALAHSALSSYDSHVHASRDAWKRDMRHSPVRVQWDPERDLDLRPTPPRSLQVGLRAEASHRYADEWTVGIDDVTELAHEIHELTRTGSRTQAAHLLPTERPYPLPGPLVSRIAASPAAAQGPEDAPPGPRVGRPPGRVVRRVTEGGR